MSVNTSLDEPSSITTLSSLFIECLALPVGTGTVAVMLFIGIVLFLPLGLFIFYLGHQRSSDQPMSHSDFFTYNIVTTELLEIPIYVLILAGSFAECSYLVLLPSFFISTLYCLQACFHALTCVERYLAVVHPIFYVSLKSERGARIRKVANVFCWFLCFGVICVLYQLTTEGYVILCFCYFTMIIVIIFFCSVSVLRVLIRPGPGDKGGVCSSIDQSKLRAFYVIAAILCVLVVKFTCNIVLSILNHILRLGKAGNCALFLVDMWLSVPSSLVCPLLFLQRAGKLTCGKAKTKANYVMDKTRPTLHT